MKVQYGAFKGSVPVKYADPIIISRRLHHANDACDPFDSAEGALLAEQLRHRDGLTTAQQRALEAIDAEYDDLERVVFDSLQSPS